MVAAGIEETGFGLATGVFAFAALVVETAALVAGAFCAEVLGVFGMLRFSITTTCPPLSPTLTGLAAIAFLSPSVSTKST